MAKSLRYISISHKSASVAQREQFHLSEHEKRKLTRHLSVRFPDVSGLLLLVTCNRTEVYFESDGTTTSMLFSELLQLKGKKDVEKYRPYFSCKDQTKATVKHLLKVASGLESKVLGDAEIIHQIKKAYLLSMDQQLQGSLLERAMQTVFRSHKRISNETQFRDGTTSVAYKSLKVISKSFDKHSARTKKILILGAGDIVWQLFKYNAKFGFRDIHVSNRTEEKAAKLAAIHTYQLYPWKKVLDNDFQGFDVIISAVSNYSALIKSIGPHPEKRILIDLGMPCNIDASITQDDRLICYDLDSISLDLEKNRKKRLAAIKKVNAILDAEMDTYMQWLERAPLRSEIGKYREKIFKKVKLYLTKEKLLNNQDTAHLLTNRVVRKMFTAPETLPATSIDIDALISEQASLLAKTPAIFSKAS